MDEFSYADAVAIATAAHAGQTDKIGRPYIEHPLRVAERVAHDPTLAMIAVLHDVIEDYWMPRFGSVLGLVFGAEHLRQQGAPGEVVDAVVALSHPRGEPNIVYWGRVRSNERARLVKLADIADNTSPERLAALDDTTRTRLVRHYGRAVRELGPTEEAG